MELDLFEKRTIAASKQLNNKNLLMKSCIFIGKYNSVGLLLLVLLGVTLGFYFWKITGFIWLLLFTIWFIAQDLYKDSLIKKLVLRLEELEEPIAVNK